MLYWGVPYSDMELNVSQLYNINNEARGVFVGNYATGYRGISYNCRCKNA